MGESLWRQKINPLTTVYVMSSIVYFGFAIEIIGSLLAHNEIEHPPDTSPFWGYIRIASVLLTALAPIPALAAFANVQGAAKEVRGTPMRILIWFVVALGFFVSLAESMWTCSGHPTWLGGFPG
ncbi:MAG: hypothetical protein WA789_05645 [Candidatus Acidiferrum sp.]